MTNTALLAAGATSLLAPPTTTPRCDPEALRRFAALRTSPGARASVHTLIVVDNPSAPGLRELVGGLADYSPDHLVRVAVMPRNEGASEARNAGMAQSFGDWTVLVSTRGRAPAVPKLGCMQLLFSRRVSLATPAAPPPPASWTTTSSPTPPSWMRTSAPRCASRARACLWASQTCRRRARSCRRHW